MIIFRVIKPLMRVHFHRTTSEAVMADNRLLHPSLNSSLHIDAKLTEVEVCYTEKAPQSASFLIFLTLLPQSSYFDHARLEAEIELHRRAIDGTSKAAKVVNVPRSAKRYQNLTPLPNTIKRVWIFTVAINIL